MSRCSTTVADSISHENNQKDLKGLTPIIIVHYVKSHLQKPTFTVFLEDESVHDC